MVTIQFHGTKNGCPSAKAEVYATEQNEVSIEISSENLPPQYITLDKRTAIKFCRQLRSAISQLED